MAISSATHRALALTEILGQILSMLEPNPRTLAAASLVNNQWFSCATDVLWRTATHQKLLRVHDNRRQIYAAKMTRLSFDGDEAASYHACFQHLAFSSLTSLSLDSYRPPEGETYHLRQYLQPPLEELEFFGGVLDQQLLDGLRGTCWKLRRILMDNPGPKITPDAFYTFITGYPSLKEMSFLYGMEHLMSDELLLHLSGRDGLSKLAIGRPCSQELLEQIAAATEKPFKELKELEIVTTAAALPALVKLVGHVSSLRVIIQDGHEGVCEQICKLSGLRNLQLAFSSPVKLSLDDVLSFKKLPRLESLEIGPNQMVEDANVDALESGFSDAHFDDLCSHLPCLRILDFSVQSNMSTAALESLSKHCRMLETCTLPLVIGLDMLDLKDREPVMFPKLRELNVGGFEQQQVRDNESTSVEDDMNEMIPLLKRHFPNLKSLDVISDDDYTNSITSRFPE